VHPHGHKKKQQSGANWRYINKMNKGAYSFSKKYLHSMVVIVDLFNLERLSEESCHIC